MNHRTPKPVMRLVPRLTILFTAFLMLVCALSSDSYQIVQKTKPQANITPEMRKQDPRLNKPVTLKMRRATVGEALAEMARQTGIEVSAGERDGASDELLAIFCKETSLARMMNGLWATMSYQGGLWEWQRTGEAGAYRYRLLQPEPARRLRQKLRDEVEKKLERDVTKLMGALDAGEERKEAVVKDIYGDPEIGFQKYYTFSKERLWADVRSFKDGLTPEQQQSVLNGDLKARVPLSALSPASREYYISLNKKKKDLMEQRGGKRSLISDPTEIIFERIQYASTPALRISVPSATTAYPVVGGIPIAELFYEKIKALWKLDGDASDDPMEDRVMTEPSDSPPEPLPYSPPKLGPNGQPQPRDLSGMEWHADGLPRRFEQISQGAQAPVIARMPQEPTMTSLPEPWNTTLREYWGHLGHRNLMVKWRDGVQLASNITWPLEDPPAPYWLLRQLRKDVKPGLLIPFGDLTTAADVLTRDQTLRLVREFPAMEGVAANRELLAIFHRFPTLARQAQSQNGLALTQDVLSMLRNLFPRQLMEKIVNSETRYLSISVTDGTVPDVSTRDVTFTLKDSEGRFIYNYKYTEKPQPRTKMEERPPQRPKGLG